MRDRIRPTKEHDDVLNRLKTEGLFTTRQKAMMFAAGLGFAAEKSDIIEPFEGIGEGIPLSVFERAGDDAFIDAMAVTQAKDLHILKPGDEDKRFEIFEHYARKGLDLISKTCFAAGQEPVQAILNLIDRYADTNPGESKSNSLDGTLKELARLI